MTFASDICPDCTAQFFFSLFFFFYAASLKNKSLLPPLLSGFYLFFYWLLKGIPVEEQAEVPSALVGWVWNVVRVFIEVPLGSSLVVLRLSLKYWRNILVTVFLECPYLTSLPLCPVWVSKSVTSGWRVNRTAEVRNCWSASTQPDGVFVTSTT